jgi:hypothetical protein
MEAGNLYRHDYDNVAEEIVWRTVRDNLAPLLAIQKVWNSTRACVARSGSEVLGFAPHHPLPARLGHGRAHPDLLTNLL